MTKNREYHEAEVARYEMLAREAEQQVTSANTPQYYRKKAEEHRLAAQAITVIEVDPSKTHKIQFPKEWGQPAQDRGPVDFDNQI